MTTKKGSKAGATGKGLTEEQKKRLQAQFGGKAMGAMTFDVGLRHHRQAPKVIIPMKLVEVMNFIYHTQTNKGNEYGMFLNCDFDEKDFTYRVNMDREVYVPKQKVTPGHIDFLEIPEREKFNTVIHRHPSGVRAFSGTDDEYINKDFEVSILFLPPFDFPTAIVNLPIKGSTTAFVQMKAEILFEFSVDGIVGLGDLVDNNKFAAYVKENVQALAPAVAPTYPYAKPDASKTTAPAGNSALPSNNTRFSRNNVIPSYLQSVAPRELSIPLGNFIDQTATYLYNAETLTDAAGNKVENTISELFEFADLISSLTDYVISEFIVENDTLFISTTEYPTINLSNVHTTFRNIVIYDYLRDLEAQMGEIMSEESDADMPLSLAELELGEDPLSSAQSTDETVVLGI